MRSIPPFHYGHHTVLTPRRLTGMVAAWSALAVTASTVLGWVTR